MSQKLTDMKLLSGQQEEITMTDLRQRPGDVVDQVQMGKKFVITKAGKVVAELESPEPTALELGAEVRRLGLAG
jgi:prevent-host-death family protein